MVLFFVASILVAKRFDKERLETGTRNTLPFVWGYVFGMGAIWIPPLCLWLRWIEPQSGEEQYSFGYTIVLVALSLAIFGSLGYFVIRRDRWAWVVLSLFGGPVIWIVNYLYGKRRWEEMERLMIQTASKQFVTQILRQSICWSSAKAMTLTCQISWQ